MAAAALGGDRRSGATEAYGPRILALLAAQPDLTLDEICAALGPGRDGAEPGLDPAVLPPARDQRQKKRRTRPSRRARTWRRSGSAGGRSSIGSRLTGWSSSTRPGPRRRWRGPGAARPGASGW